MPITICLSPYCRHHLPPTYTNLRTQIFPQCHWYPRYPHKTQFQQMALSLVETLFYNGCRE